MNQIFLAAINSSYVHTNPAVRLLASACAGVSYEDYNINQQMADVLADIVARKAQAVLFSCYIWNIEYIKKLATDLKKIDPKTLLCFGGPEVSFDAERFISENSFVDYVFIGEGEDAFAAFCSGCRVFQSGVLWRKDGEILGEARYLLKEDFEHSPLPFLTEEYDPNRIYYYESTRGCPFSCAYCLSGGSAGVREKSLKKVFEDLNEYTRRSVRLVKFVDRTFNANKPRAKEILRYILEHTGETCYHFEIALDLLDEEMLLLLECFPKDKIQLEAGIQSCNAQTLAAVSRKTNIGKALENAKRIVKTGNIHLHLDLIAGLPHESYESFLCSLDMVYQAYPQALQLGFLKLLKGSVLRQRAEEYGIIYRDYAPYEVLQTADITAEELLSLKNTEELLNRYYNSGRARQALDFLTQTHGMKPSKWLKILRIYCETNGFLRRPVSVKTQFQILLDCFEAALEHQPYQAFLLALRKDYDAMNIKGLRPRQFQ